MPRCSGGSPWSASIASSSSLCHPVHDRRLRADQRRGLLADTAEQGGEVERLVQRLGGARERRVLVGRVAVLQPRRLVGEGGVGCLGERQPQLQGRGVEDRGLGAREGEHARRAAALGRGHADEERARPGARVGHQVGRAARRPARAGARARSRRRPARSRRRGWRAGRCGSHRRPPRCARRHPARERDQRRRRHAEQPRTPHRRVRRTGRPRRAGRRGRGPARPARGRRWRSRVGDGLATKSAGRGPPRTRGSRLWDRQSAASLYTPRLNPGGPPGFRRGGRVAEGTRLLSE